MGQQRLAARLDGDDALAEQTLAIVFQLGKSEIDGGQRLIDHCRRQFVRRPANLRSFRHRPLLADPAQPDAPGMT